MMKNTLQQVTPLEFVTMRFIVAALILMVVFHNKLRQLLKRRVILYCIVLGTINVSVVFFQMTGLRFTSASNSAFITSFSVLLVPFFAAAILKKRPKASSIAGVLVAFFGLFLITGGLDTALNIGDFFTFLCAASIALHMVLVVLFIKKEDSLVLSIGQPIIGALFCVAVCVFTAGPVFQSISLNKELILSLLYVGGLCTAGNCTAQIYVQKYVNPVSVALILLLEPVFALMFALVFKGPDGQTETLTILKAAGALLIVGGAMLSELNAAERMKAFFLKNRRKGLQDKEMAYEETLKGTDE